ncbi:DEAD/DEAH box helicase [Solirubrobacter phytolaccae]|uniref:DEAD/DEAH box helicase n=1 Tax=Solirubrobacter phytolaccae TaxID=1404360 RepID=A0A9X3N6X6_9ACTN|nr:DEAD/DEAH box helicase [Solirubrobacter phytolaccae]MDA0180719.1 DEAD/DEAH box helicase [Solirubrobacter phytolaccae]
MREADPVHHVELRVNAQGHDSVVFCFPYRADIVDAVRSIPGRRFDWQAKEWWAPRAEATAPYVQGVLERFPELDVAPDVSEWLAKAVKGWVGRVTTARRDAKGWFVLDAIAGDLNEELAAVAEERGDRRWLPFTQEVAEQLLDLPGARMDQRALRCATKLQVGLDPAPATLMLVESYGESRFKLEVNWDPDTVGAFVKLPAAEAHGRTLPIDPYLLEPLEHFIRLHDIDVGSNAREALGRLRTEHDAAIDDVRRSRAADGEVLSCEPRLGGELRPFQRAGVRYALQSRRLFIADEQGLGKTVEALATLEEDDAYPAVVICPASLKLNWEREAATWLPHRTLHVVSGTGKAIPKAEITVLNYEIVHAHRERLAVARPKALILDESHYVKNPAAKRTRAVRRLAESLPEGALKLCLTGTPVMNHPDELIAQLRILGRLEEFGSGARFKRRFQGAGAEERIHWHLRRTCFVRRLKKEVLPQLPEKRQVIVPVALENEKEYRLAEKDVVAWLQEQPIELGELEAKVAATLRAERLAQLNTLRQLAGRGKLGAALAWIDDFMQSEEPLVVFASHRELQERVVARFPDALHVVGADKVTERDAAVQAFQDPDGPNLIVCSTRVAGQGITLTRASNVAFLDLEWSPAMHDQAEDRLHRIGQRDAVTAWYLLAAETIDEQMSEVLARKRGIVGAITDGRADESEAVLQSVVRALRGKPLRRLRAVA